MAKIYVFWSREKSIKKSYINMGRAYRCSGSKAVMLVIPVIPIPSWLNLLPYSSVPALGGYSPECSGDPYEPLYESPERYAPC